MTDTTRTPMQPRRPRARITMLKAEIGAAIAEDRRRIERLQLTVEALLERIDRLEQLVSPPGPRAVVDPHRVAIAGNHIAGF